MSEEQSGGLSRRQFLAGCAGCAAVASAPAAATGQQMSSPPSPSIRSRSFGNDGEISPYGQAQIAAFDREFVQQRGSRGETYHVVKDWGLDPTGGDRINDTFEAKVSGLSNATVVFPGDARFAVAPGDLVISPDGPIDIIGNGASLVVPDGAHNCRPIDGRSLPSGTLIKGLTVDMTGDDLRAETRIETDGTVRVENVEMKGYLPPLPRDSTDIDAIATMMARTESATIQCRNFRAIGGTAADMHSDEGDMPPSAPENQRGTPIGLWVGQSTVGTVQMVGCKFRGWQNGTYSGRTHGTVQFLGGVYWNNSNCQIRISGGSVVDGATLLIDDRQWSMKQNPGPYSLGAHQGVLIARVDPGGNKGNQKDPARFINVRVKGLSMQTLPALLNWEGSAGPGLIRNTKITNHIDVPSILGAPPGSQFTYDAAPQTNIMVKNSLITGSTKEIAVVKDRPQSRITKTCIAVPGAGPDGISGMDIDETVSFGPQCKGTGLKNPKKVGNPGDISSLPVPTNPSNPSNPSGSRPNPQRRKGIITMMVTTVLLILGLIAAVIVGAVGALAKLITGS